MKIWGVAKLDQKLQVVSHSHSPKACVLMALITVMKLIIGFLLVVMEIAYQSIMNHLRRLIRFSLATSESILVVNHNIIQMMFL